MCVFYFFFFKQKTAYEMRISDWSSDVCSSDLPTIVTIDLEAARALFLDSVKRIEAEDFPAAEQLLWQALRLAPERPSLLCNLAAVLFRQSKFAQARDIAERAVKLDPQSPQIGRAHV